MTVEQTFSPVQFYSDKHWEEVGIMVWEVEKLRRGVGVPVTELDEDLILTAQGKAEDFNRRNYFSHVDPDGDRPPFSENIAKGHASALEAFRGFMRSPSHLMNMVDPRWTRIGIGICGLYRVQHFAR